GFWESLRQGVSGVDRTTRYDVSTLPVKVSAEVKNFDLQNYLHAPKVNRLELTVQYGLAAAVSAVRDAKLKIEDMAPDRIGVVEGTTTSGATNVLKVQQSMLNKQKIHPYDAIGGYCGEGSSRIGMSLG